MTFELLTIDPAKRWKFEDYDSGNTWVVSGKQIREEGFKVDIPNSPRFPTHFLFGRPHGVLGGIFRTWILQT